MPTVLVIMADGFEEIEAFTPIDLLRRSGVEVATASLSENRHVTGRSGITAHTDTTITEAMNRSFTMVMLPGGPGVKLLRADLRVTQIVRRHAEAKAWLAAICAAPTVLLDCNLLRNCRYTAHFSVSSELPRILLDEKVVTDGQICTSRGAGTAMEFGLQLVTLMCGAEKACEIGKDICL